MRYVYDAEEKKRFEAVQFPVHWTIGEYMEWKGYKGEEPMKTAINTYGKNRHVLWTRMLKQCYFMTECCSRFMMKLLFCNGLE